MAVPAACRRPRHGTFAPVVGTTAATDNGARIVRTGAAADLSQPALPTPRASRGPPRLGWSPETGPRRCLSSWPSRRRAGRTVAQLSGTGVVPELVHAAHATNDSGRADMRQPLLSFLGLDAYLDGQAAPATI